MEEDLNSKLDILLDQSDDGEELLLLLKSMHILKIDPTTSEPIPLNVTEGDIKTMEKVISYTKCKPIVLKEAYRCLRNCVVLNPQVQDEILNSKIIDITHDVFAQLVEEEKPEALKMVILFLTNFCVNNSNTGRAVWEKFHDEFCVLLDKKIYVNNSCALIYNILCQNKDLEPEYAIWEAIFNLMEQNDESEYLCFIVEHFIKNKYLISCYKQLKAEHRMLILVELKEKVVKENDDNSISLDLMRLLVDEFKQKSDCILKTVTDYLKNVEPLEVALLLEIIASCSSNDQFVKVLQNDRSLLINSVFLLKSMHSAGKEGDNCFTAIQKLSEMKLGEDAEIKEHPGFGFKVGLIRVIGNLAWKNRPNQDEMRELECIPLLLDCCNMDARNPFIIQWVIFAIRNLSEKNPENQRVIASLTKRGVVESSTLHEMGITLHGEGDSEIKIAPVVFK